MDLILDAIGISAVLAIVVVVICAAVIYAVIKKKKDSDYDEAGIPKLVEKPERTEGSTEAVVEKTVSDYSYEPKQLKNSDKPED